MFTRNAIGVLSAVLSLCAPGMDRHHDGPSVRGLVDEPRRGENVRAAAPPTGAVASALQKCAACHAGVASMPANLKDAAGINTHLPFMNDHVLKAMMEKAKVTPEEKAALEGVVQNARAEASKGTVDGFKVVPKIAPCYLSPAENKKSVDLLPTNLTPSSALAIRLKHSIEVGAIMAYNHSTTPRTWQSESIGRGDSRGVHLLNEKFIVRPANDRDFDYPMNGGSGEFPWKRAAATDLAPGVVSHHYVIPAEAGPLAESLSRSKQTHPNYFGGSVGVEGPNLGWEHNKGNQFVEALSMEEPGTGRRIVFEIRTRMKNSAGVWVSDVLRPFATPQDLHEETKKLCASGEAPAECKDPSVATFLAAVLPPQTKNVALASMLNKDTAKTGRFAPLDMNLTAEKALLAEAEVQMLPTLPPKVVTALLTKTGFKSTMGTPWIKPASGKGTSWGAMSDSPYHPFPKGTMFSHFKQSQSSCNHCHDTAGKHVKLFDPKRERMDAVESKAREGGTRTWYNFVEGDDQTFSWNPFTPEAAKDAKGVFDAASHFKCLGSGSSVLKPKK